MSAAVKRFSLNTSIVPALDATKILSDVTCIPTGVLNLTLFALSSPSSSVFIANSRIPVPALATTVYPLIVPSKLNFWTACLEDEVTYKILSSSGDTSTELTVVNSVSRSPPLLAV